jgi:hypothetical protein
MADNLTTQSTTPATVPASTQIATDEVASVHYQRVKLVDGTADSTTAIPGDATYGLDVDVTRVQGTVTVGDGGNTLSVDDGGGSLTVDGTVAVSGSVAVTGPLTDAQLRASAVPVSGTFYQATQPVSGTVGVSGTVTVDGSGVTQPVSGPLTDTQLRATDVDVNLTNASVAVTGTFWQATQPVSGSVSVSNFPATQPVSGTFWQATQPVSFSGQSVGISGTPTVTQVPAASGGLSMSSTLSSASSGTATNVKSSAGQVFGWVITNTSASPRYVKFYNSASTPTAGSGTPVLRIMVPGNTSGAGVVAAEFTNGIAFSSGIGFTIVSGVADNDATNISANEVIVNTLYK